MSFAYFVFSLVVLGSLPVAFYFIQTVGLSKVPSVSVNKKVALTVWVVTGVISCLLAWFYPMLGLLGYVIELTVFLLVIIITFKSFTSSRFWAILKKLLGF